MQGKNHAVCGAAIAVPALFALTGGSLGAVAVGVPIAIVGALLPDIDTRHFALRGGIWRGWQRVAKAARTFGLWGEPFALAALLVGIVMAGTLGTVSWVLRRFVSHRGFTHTLLCTALVGSLALWGSTAAFASWVPGAALTVGYLSHLFTDAMTMRGVELFGPVVPVAVHLLPPGVRFRNGTAMEAVAVFAVLLASVSAFALASLRLGVRL